MHKKQIIVLVIPPVLTAFMYPIFSSLAGALVNDRIAWYLGLIIYWLVWGLAFSLIIIGKKDIIALIRPQKTNENHNHPDGHHLAGSIGCQIIGTRNGI